MGSYARPRPIRRILGQTGSHRIQADVRNCCQQMQVVHGDRSKPALKEVTGPPPSRVNEIGVAPMRFSDGQPETIRSRRTENEVNMIGHQAVRPHLDTGLAGLLGQQISIDILVAVFKKDWLAAIATLRYVMRKAGNHHTRQSCHGENYHERSAGDRYHVPLSLHGDQPFGTQHPQHLHKQTVQSYLIIGPEPGEGSIADRL